jgi:hypothetical protein
VKKLWLAVVLIALGGLASRTFADVQNIRLSGDIRVRGYFLDSGGAVDPTTAQSGQLDSNASFIEQRTRVSVEADLEDHVLVVVTLAAEGQWGDGTTTGFDAGAGVPAGAPINRKWGVGVDEAYVQLNELFYTPATLKLGRQYLHYGHGLIISSVEQEYNYDAGRLVLDYYPLTIDLVGAELVNNQSFGATPHISNNAAGTLGASDLLFVNARYELSDSAIKNVEAYLGWVSQSENNPVISSRVPPTGVIGSSPLIVGLRADVNPVDALQAWIEGAYEFGDDGAGNDLSAGIFNLGARYTMKDVQWVPAINGNYIFATGGGRNGVDGNFVPWFDYVDGYNGYLFEPMLSNIHIFNLGASVKPYENTTLSLQAYYYLKAENGSPAGSNPNVDFGGPTWGVPIVVGAINTGDSRELGWELDGILGYDYSKDVRAQLVYAVFLPAGAYEQVGVSRAAQEVRAELNVKF